MFQFAGGTGPVPPMIEFGGRYDIDETTILRPYLAVLSRLPPGRKRLSGQGK
jgi:hypothetical protein